jgi:rhodanese-related sulfurtransferase
VPRSAADVLAAARARLTRVTAAEARARQEAGALLVDVRTDAQRVAAGEIPGARVIALNHLEWRLDPQSPSRIAEAADHDLEVIVLCAEGYSSSLAAARLHELGLHRATDVVDGFAGWQAADLPVIPPAAP